MGPIMLIGTIRLIATLCWGYSTTVSIYTLILITKSTALHNGCSMSVEFRPIDSFANSVKYFADSSGLTNPVSNSCKPSRPWLRLRDQHLPKPLPTVANVEPFQDVVSYHDLPQPPLLGNQQVWPVTADSLLCGWRRQIISIVVYQQWLI